MLGLGVFVVGAPAVLHDRTGGIAMAPNNNRPHLLTPEEAAAQLRRRPSTLRNWRWRGEGPDYIRYGGRVHYTMDAITRWLSSHQVSPESTA